MYTVCGMSKVLTTKKVKEMELPTKKIKASRKSPKRLVIYGPPKIGKTTALSKLDNCLIIDLEDGSDMIDAIKLKADNFSDLSKIGKAIMEKNKPYKYIAIDTITKLEEWCEAEGKKILYLRMAYKKWIERLNKLADHIILVGHLKDKMIEKKGKEVSSKDLDLTGKIKQITCTNADAIGYIYREKGETMISFNAGEEIAAGSRCEHLKGQEMPLDWNKIFID